MAETKEKGLKMAQNTFKTTSKVEKALAFAWEAYEGFADHCEFHNDELPSAVDNTGYTKQIRRPSRHKATVTSVNQDYSLPGVMNPIVPYGQMVDSSFTFAITDRFETNLQVSMEDILFNLEKSDVMSRHIEPAIIEHRNKINACIASYIEAAAGNTLVTDKTTDGYNSAIYQARQLMINRAGISDGQEKTLLLNTGVLPVLATGNAKIFHSVNNAGQFQNGDFEKIAGFNIYESPTLSTPTYTSFGNSMVVASSQHVDELLTAPWTPTTKIAVSGGTANVTIKAGTKIKFTNGSKDIRWTVPTIDADAGFASTFTVVSDSVLDGSGNGLLEFSEPFIAGGDFKNVSDNLVAGSTKITAVTTAGTLLTPSYAFAKQAIWLGSPAVKYPKGVDSGISLKLGGFNIALIEDHWPGTLQSITKIVSFLAVGIAKPEAITCIY